MVKSHRAAHGGSRLQDFRNAVTDYAQRSARELHKDGDFRTKYLPAMAEHAHLAEQAIPGTAAVIKTMHQVSEAAKKHGFGKYGRMKKARRGGNWSEFWDTLQHPDTWGDKLKNEFTNPNSELSNEIMNPNSDLRSKIIPGAAAAAQFIPGLGEVGDAIEAVNTANTWATRGQQAYNAMAGPQTSASVPPPSDTPVGPMQMPTSGGWASKLTGSAYNRALISSGKQPHHRQTYHAAMQRVIEDVKQLRARDRKEFGKYGHVVQKNKSGKLRAIKAKSYDDYYRNYPEAVFKYYGKIPPYDALQDALKHVSGKPGRQATARHVDDGAKPKKARKATSYLKVKAIAHKMGIKDGKIIYKAAKSVDQDSRTTPESALRFHVAMAE